MCQFKVYISKNMFEALVLNLSLKKATNLRFVDSNFEVILMASIANERLTNFKANARCKFCVKFTTHASITVDLSARAELLLQ